MDVAYPKITLLGGGPIATAVFAVIIILEATLVARPYFADDTRFSWRMFVQTVDIQVCLPSVN